jgi:hypothetical protein
MLVLLAPYVIIACWIRVYFHFVMFIWYRSLPSFYLPVYVVIILD